MKKNKKKKTAKEFILFGYILLAFLSGIWYANNRVNIMAQMETETGEEAWKNNGIIGTTDIDNGREDSYNKTEDPKDGDKNTGTVNINTASLEELMLLEGIGEKKAQNILDYRAEQGGFQRAEDIKNVSGIGEKTYEGLKDKITVD